MADYQCYPLWEASPGLFGDIAPDSLPISAPLRKDLLAWVAEFDRTLDLGDPSTAGFDSQASADIFIATGYELLSRLKDELGPDYEVVHFFKANPKPSPA